MQILNGMWVSLVDRRNGCVMFQVATDTVSDEEFKRLWALAGNSIARIIAESKDGATVEMEVRATKV